MQSPIPELRTQVLEPLDEMEENVMDAIQEYRDADFIKPFNNYKNYYQDAIDQNKML
jgi:hypothetical protein